MNGEKGSCRLVNTLLALAGWIIDMLYIWADGRRKCYEQKAPKAGIGGSSQTCI